MISAYAKTSSGLRTASFRQNFGSHNKQLYAATDELGNKGSQLKDHHDQLGLSPKNNNYLSTGRSSKTTTNQQANNGNVMGKSLNAEDYHSTGNTNN